MNNRCGSVRGPGTARIKRTTRTDTLDNLQTRHAGAGRRPLGSEQPRAAKAAFDSDHGGAGAAYGGDSRMPLSPLFLTYSST